MCGLRLGVNIEYEGKEYDILELPANAFVQLIPGLSLEKFRKVDEAFEDYWPEITRRRRHVLAFFADQLGTSIDFLLLNSQPIHFEEADIAAYIQEHTEQSRRPS
ncbi:MAG: hypothetical protein K6T83_15670 [Alicyclobacillus sp.]|nr:hypothetical protein [Alicyclobacillus sp.]